MMDSGLEFEEEGKKEVVLGKQAGCQLRQVIQSLPNLLPPR